MEKQTPTLSWGAQKRLQYLEFKLFWEGRVNRGDLTAAFGISVPQASADFARYQALAPYNMSYNSSAKYYVPNERFSPILIRPNAEAYFAELLSSSSIESNTSSFHDYIDLVPNPTRLVGVAILRAIVQAAKNKQKISVDYRSFKHSQAGNTRWITPHAFGSDGFRWHVRAFCHTDHKFKDYVLGRIVDISGTADSDVDVKLDRQWFSYIDVIVGPCLTLSDDQKNLVAMDYGMTDQRLAIRCRIALLYYLLKKLGIDIDGKVRAGEEQQIVAINIDEVRAAIKS